MSDVVASAKAARERLAQGLGALQGHGVPEQLLSAAEPIARAMNALHRVEVTNGQTVVESGPAALDSVRAALGILQAQNVNHPSVEAALEAVAGSLGLIHRLVKLTSAPPPANPAQAAPFAATAVASNAALGPNPAAPPQYAPQHAAPPPQFAAQPQYAPQHAAPPPQFAAPAQAQPHYAQQHAAPQQPQYAPQHAAPQQPQYAPHAAPPPQFAAPPQAQPQYTPHNAKPSPQAQPQFAPMARQAAQPAAHAQAPAPAPAYGPGGPASDGSFAPNSTLQSQGAERAPAGAAPFRADETQPEAKPLAQSPAVPSQLRLEAALGAHSATNFYKGLSGNDVVDAGGIFIATYQIPRIGTPLLLKVSLPGGYEFDAQAVVRWTREASTGVDGASPGFGAQFTQISSEGRQLVYRYVRNREPLFHDDL